MVPAGDTIGCQGLQFEDIAPRLQTLRTSFLGAREAG